MHLRATCLLLGLSLTCFVGSDARAQFRPAGRTRRPTTSAPLRDTVKGRPSATPTRALPQPDRAPQSSGAKARSNLQAGNEGTLNHLFAALRKRPTESNLLERVVAVGRAIPEAMARGMMALEQEANSNGASSAIAAIALHALLERTGAYERADRLFESMTVRYPSDPRFLEHAADRAFSRGQAARGCEHLAKALANTSPATQKVRLLRRLRNAYLDAGDTKTATSYQQQLQKDTPPSPQLALEFGRELLARAEYHAALLTLRPLTATPTLEQHSRRQLWHDIALAAFSSGDLLLAKRVVGQLLFTQRAPGEVDADLKRMATEIHRREGNLLPLIEQLQTSPPLTYVRLDWLAELHEELGRTDRAIEYRRKSIAKRPHDLEGHLALLYTLEVAGDLEQMQKERELVVRRFPECVEQAILLANEWQRRGEPRRAEAILDALERQHALGADSLYRLSDAWEHLGQRARAQRIIGRLSSSHPSARADATRGATAPLAGGGPNTPAYLSSTAGAASERSPIDGLLQQADTAITEGHLPEAIALLDRVRQSGQSLPTNVARVATLLERAAASATKESAALREQAENLWVTLLLAESLPESEVPAAIERVVRLWSLRGALAEKAPQLAQRFAESPANRTRGLWLAEAEARLARYESAERTLTTLSSHVPEDKVVDDKLLALWLKRGNVVQSIELIERRLNHQASFDPVLLHRLVDLSAKARRDDLALAFTKRWVTASATDPNAWHVYARLIRQQKLMEASRARSTLLRAYQLAQDRYDLLLELSEWESQDGETQASFGHLLSILRNASEEAQLTGAARRAVPLGAALGRLEDVELVLRQASARTAAGSGLRETLLDVYSSLARVARSDQQSADDSARKRADALLLRVGQRAGATLVSVLTDRNESRHERALELLSAFVPNAVAGDLLTFAGGAASTDLRIKALLLAGHCADPKLLPRFAAFLRARDIGTTATPLAKAAAYGISRIATAKATSELKSLLARGSPELQALAALWLAERMDRSGTAEMRTLGQNREHSGTVRAAAQLALAHLGEPTEDLVGRTSPPESRSLKLVSLAILANSRLGARVAQTADLLAQEPETDLRPAVAIAGRMVGATCVAWHDVLVRPESVLDLERLLLDLTQCSPSPEQTLELFLQIAEPLGRALSLRISSGADAARQTGRLLLAHDTELSLVPLTPHPKSLSGTDRRRLSAGLDKCLAPLAIAYEKLLDHADTELRRLALGIRVLSTHDDKALMAGLRDPAPEVRRRAIALARHHSNETLTLRIGDILRGDADFAVRQAAADALGRLGRPPMHPQLLEILRNAARNDPFASVRMAALTSLSRKNPLAAANELSYAERHDSEPEVVDLARKLRENRP